MTRNISSSSLTLGLPNVSSVTSLSSLGAGGQMSYNTLHTSMSMNSLDGAGGSDDDDLGGDAGIANGIIEFGDDLEGGEVRPYSQSTAQYYHYDPSSSSPLPRIPSIASLTEVVGEGQGGLMRRIGSNLSTVQSQFLPSPPSSRPASPTRGGRGEGDRAGGRMSPQQREGAGAGVRRGMSGAGPHAEGTALTAEG